MDRDKINSQYSQASSPAQVKTKFKLFHMLFSPFRWLWNAITWLRQMFMNLLLLLLLVFIFVGVDSEDTKEIPEKAALRISPSGFLVDQRNYVDPMTQLLQQNNEQELETLVRDIVDSIDAARDDERITGIVLDLSHLMGGGLSKLNEIAQALIRFKSSAKPIIAIGDVFSQDQYFLASYADEIHLNPQGSLLLSGYSSYRNYYRSALEKLNINFHVFKVGTYKDYVEPYLRDDMSAASREHNGQWLHELWSSYTQQVEENRQLAAGSINDYINNIDEKMRAVNGNNAQLALDLGLVDFLSNRQDSARLLQEKFGENISSDLENHAYASIDYRDYKKYRQGQTFLSDHLGDKVGLIVASGTILDGKQPAGNIGGDSLAKLFRDARANSNIKALVLRIDSGGGSAFASEIIRAEIQSTRDAGIPVVVSMGSVAASGGYWIATASDRVFATPATITGSIGVFGAFPTLENTLGDLGIYTDGLGTTQLAGGMRLDRPLSPLAANVIQQSVEHTYRNFLSLVASARNSTPEAIDRIAQGRVWSGMAAAKLNLIDELGYLNDAIESAAKIAKLDSYDLLEIRQNLTPAQEFMQRLADVRIIQEITPRGLLHNLTPNSLQQALAPLLSPFQQIDAMNDPRAIYLQCTSCTAP